MNEWFQKVLTRAKDLWSKWKTYQKIIFFAFVALIVILVVVAVRVSSTPSSVRVFNSRVTDQVELTRILDRITQENIDANENDGYIYVDDSVTVRRVRDVLISENLVPSYIDPWQDVFNRTWSTTDADQNVKIKNAMQKQLQQHIEAIRDVQRADVNIVLPDDKLFVEEQRPVSASIILHANPTSTLLTDRNRILGIQRLILSAVEGLTEENLIITDGNGKQINDFEGMAEFDRLSNIEKQQKIIHKQEAELRAKILNALQSTFGQDRCRDMVVYVEMDMSQRSTEATEYSPIVIRPDNPDTPYDDSEYRDTLPISVQSVSKEWQGTGYNPEGPAGVEGQTPPVYSDMSNVIGKSTETGLTQNNVINTKQISEINSPKIDRISVSVNLDGKWRQVKDERGFPILDEENRLKREYTPISAEDLAKAESQVKGAIGYDRERGDLVVVTNIAYDRDDEFAEEDAAYFAAIQRRRTILLILISIIVVLVGFVLFRIISKEIERRKRLREEELLRKQQAAREAALWEAKDEGDVVTMSVEESRRMELQENAVNMAKEHPEDVAMLIRTWLMEE